MAIEIPVRRKHIAGKGVYGHRRSHNGNNAKKQLRGFNNGKSEPYVKEDHALILLGGRKKRMIHRKDYGGGSTSAEWWRDAVQKPEHKPVD